MNQWNFTKKCKYIDAYHVRKIQQAPTKNPDMAIINGEPHACLPSFAVVTFAHRRSARHLRRLFLRLAETIKGRRRRFHERRRRRGRTSERAGIKVPWRTGLRIPCIIGKQERASARTTWGYMKRVEWFRVTGIPPFFPPSNRGNRSGCGCLVGIKNKGWFEDWLFWFWKGESNRYLNMFWPFRYSNSLSSLMIF